MTGNGGARLAIAEGGASGAMSVASLVHHASVLAIVTLCTSILLLLYGMHRLRVRRRAALAPMASTPPPRTLRGRGRPFAIGRRGDAPPGPA